MRKIEWVKEFAILTGGVAIVAAAISFFLVPSHAAVSSISGLAIVLSNVIPLSISMITFILNMVLLIMGWLLCGPEFGYKTVYTSIMLPAFMGVFEKFVPGGQSLTGDQTLDVFAYVILVSLGLSILFNRNASAGGLSVAVKIVNKFFNIEHGKAMTYMGIVIAFSAALVYDFKTVVLSFIGTFLNGIVLDYFIFGHNEKKRVCIITKKEEEVRKYILHEIHSGATLCEVKGAYNMEKYNEIVAIVDKHGYQKIMKYMSSKDPNAFITVYSVNDIKCKSKI